MSTLNTPSVAVSPREDAMQLHRAFKGMGCDTSTVINILAHRDAEQRGLIQQEFETRFGDELVKHLHSELHGHVKKAVLLWMHEPVARDATILRNAFKGTITNHEAAIEVICSRSSAHLRQIKQIYYSMFDTRLQQDIESEAFGNYKKLLLAYVSTTRYEGPEIDKLMVENDVKALHRAEDNCFIQIFCERSRAHLVAVESAFHATYGKPLRKVLKRETSGIFKHALMTILQCAEDPAKYFAKVLHKAMKGLGTDDTTLIRVVVTRAEFDMRQVKLEYRKIYKKTLYDAVHSETSGNYRSFLLSLIGSNV
ncbi:hypothetical protein HS088_TW05G00248 [Tripterygium wilfordii]|uniref:Annexin n=1 Tax=Tripterygium wilfordii TaxID=458696 RepID=A0A7J7DMD4_TRIWF|nr:hypothetical protein HS088_TW05G00248 [Tripterygium wilfordii]